MDALHTPYGLEDDLKGKLLFLGLLQINQSNEHKQYRPMCILSNSHIKTYILPVSWVGA